MDCVVSLVPFLCNYGWLDIRMDDLSKRVEFIVDYQEYKGRPYKAMAGEIC